MITAASSAAVSSKIPLNNLIEHTYLQLATMVLAEGGLKKREKAHDQMGNQNDVSKERMRELFDEAQKGEIQTFPYQTRGPRIIDDDGASGWRTIRWRMEYSGKISRKNGTLGFRSS